MNNNSGLVNMCHEYTIKTLGVRKFVRDSIH